VVVVDTPGLTNIVEVVERTVLGDALHSTATVGDDETLLLELGKLLRSVGGEAELARDVDSLTARELHLCTTESLDEVLLVGSLGADREEDLTDLNASNHASRLTECTTHTSLQTISTGAGKHLVDTQHVEGVHAHTQMETILASELGEVLVGADTGSLKSLTAVVLTLKRHHVDAQRHILRCGVLVAKIEHTDLRIRHTTAIPALDVRLALYITIATTRTPAHFVLFFLFIYKKRKKNNKQTNTRKHKMIKKPLGVKEITIIRYMIALSNIRN